MNYAYEDLPLAVVSAASRAVAEVRDMGALHIGSHVILSLVNQGLIAFPPDSGMTVAEKIASNEVA